MLPMSQPEPLTQSTSTLSPRRSVSLRLYGGIAAAMQHQSGVAAEQTRGVDAKRQIGADSLWLRNRSADDQRTAA